MRSGSVAVYSAARFSRNRKCCRNRCCEPLHVGAANRARAIMTIEYDPFLALADAVAEVLRESGPLRPKGIAKRLRRRGWGNPPLNAVNKVLSQYLTGRVEQCSVGQWAMVQWAA